ncbi:T9SS type A sorting domain-containing protein [Hymenobacter sp. BT186]|uniref:T9SS type A sorting domain-containing protein n=1 Tax=Hymenobacter telluris TaxID=2816474 RepID=A0A939EZD9_9BACT|nr:M43 family zinc metalloprotease [Hymenobacter telluris]MBO0358673.1 T9SS type A sorting domain-containing protein [Hymenobacter telluris]MBW3374699.1 T9SS type A sorting domain-containing protein [Hymenobacter norwichensis]
MPLRQLLNYLLLIAVLGFGSRPAAAQQLRTLYPEQRYGFRCASDSMQQVQWRQNPAAEQQYRAFLRQTAMLSAADQARILAQPDVTVPVVVHIIHTGTANNISDAQVNDAIRILNEDYSKTNPDTSSVIAAFQPIYANIGFRFRLAKKDPDGNCTTGITRTYSSLTSSASDNVKSLIRWDTNRYLNIWVVDNIASGAGGYAYLPCPPTGIDGIVIRNSQFASIGRSCGSNFCNRSLTHEVGHYFGLPHTWGGTNTPGMASNCGLDDGIADTPNTSGVGSGCPVSTYRPCNPNSTTGSSTPNNNPNGILANVQNYMDYATCALMFTTGQKTVMRASLLLTCRATLVSAANLNDTGTNDGYIAVPCAPVAAFQSTTPSVCEGGTVTYTDYSYNYTFNAANTQFDWRFAGGQPATSTQRNPTVTYPTAGSYDATLIVITPAGRDTLTLTQLVRVQGPNSGERAPLVESFENADFPQSNPAAPIRNWQISTSLPGGQGLTWERATGVASNGSAFLQVRNNFLPTGTVSTLTSPNINLSNISGTATLLFDRAFALRTTASNEQLLVSYSTDCGVTWLTLQAYNATALSTRGSNPQIGFVPTAADWQTLSLPLPSTVQRAQRFQLRLEDISTGGNPLYIDNLRILDPLGIQDAEMARRGISVYPNPLTAETAVHFTLTGTERAQVRLTDLLGREVTRTALKSYGAGAQSIRLQASNGAALPAGVYMVQLTIGEKTFTTKVLVQ